VIAVGFVLMLARLSVVGSKNGIANNLWCMCFMLVTVLNGISTLTVHVNALEVWDLSWHEHSN